MFSGRAFQGDKIKTTASFTVEDPAESANDIQTNASVAIKNLDLDGTPKSNLKEIEELSKAKSFGAVSNLLPRIKTMNKRYENNVKIMMNYDKFI